MANPKTFQVDIEKCKALVQLKRDYFSGKLSFEEARELLVQRFPVVTPEEFAYGEQQLKEEGVTDQDMQDRMDDLLRLFEPVLQVRKLDSLPEGHPVKSYLDENRALEPVLAQAEACCRKTSSSRTPGWRYTTSCWRISNTLPGSTTNCFLSWKRRDLTVPPP